MTLAPTLNPSPHTGDSVRGRVEYALGRVLDRCEHTVCFEVADSDGLWVKLALDGEGSTLLRAEAAALTGLSGPADLAELVRPYVPRVSDSFSWARPDNVVSADPFASVFGAGRGAAPHEDHAPGLRALALEVASGLRTLEDVHAAYPNGVHAKDSAWMFRRLLMALGLVHAAGYVHGRIDDKSLRIEPQNHGLVISDFESARTFEAKDGDGAWAAGARAAMRTDIAAGVAAIARLTDWAQTPRRLRVFYEHLMAAQRLPSGLDLLDEYDLLLEELWGPRRFRPFALPSPTHNERGHHGPRSLDNQHV